MKNHLKTKNILSALVIGSLLVSFSLAGCQSSGMTDYATTDSSGLEYKIVKDEPGETAKPGDYMKISIKTIVHDSTLMDTYEQGPGYQWMPLQDPSGQKYDLMEGLALLSKGDSVVFRIPADSVMNGFNRPPFVEDGDMIHVHVNVFDIQSEDGYQKELAKENEEQDQKDAGIIDHYVDSLGGKSVVTDDGVHVIIHEDGEGEKAQDGQNVSIMYTGKLLDGTKFDSNVDTSFHHSDPLDFVVGSGMMIKGMDSGIKMLNKNAKATLVIPSSKAYGSNGRPPVIQPNSVLAFDVEVLDISGNPNPDTPQGE